MVISKKIGLLLATIHIVVFICFVFYLEFLVSDGQERLLWTIWLPIDFPVSLLVPFIFETVPKDEGIFQVLRIYAPHFVHGVLGPIWWYFLSMFSGLVFSRIGQRS